MNYPKLYIQLILFILFFSCSSELVYENSPNKNKSITNTVQIYQYKDYSGGFTLQKERKLEKQNLITRQQIMNGGINGEVVEKSLAVLEIGSLKKKSITRPISSQFTLWLEGKKYFSQLNVNYKTRKLEVLIENPLKQSKISESFSFPPGAIFCFYSQVSECLKLSNVLIKTLKSPKLKVNLMLIWDSYPFHNDLFEGLEKSPFTQAKFYFNQTDDGLYNYSLETANQIMFYQFNQSFDLVKFSWVSQGISQNMTTTGVTND